MRYDATTRWLAKQRQLLLPVRGPPRERKLSEKPIRS